MLKNIQRQYLFATMNKLINVLYVFGFQAIGFQLAISDCKVFDFKIRNECCFFFHFWWCISGHYMIYWWIVFYIYKYIFKNSRVRKIEIGELFLVWHFADNFIKGFSRDRFLEYEFDVFLDLLSVYCWEAGLKIKDRTSKLWLLGFHGLF